MILFSSFDTRIFVRNVFLTTNAIHFHCFYIAYSTAFLGFLISFFISSYSLSTLFTETNSSWIIYELVKVLGIKTLMVFNLVFAINTLLKQIHRNETHPVKGKTKRKRFQIELKLCSLFYDFHSLNHFM